MFSWLKGLVSKPEDQPEEIKEPDDDFDDDGYGQWFSTHLKLNEDPNLSLIHI